MKTVSVSVKDIAELLFGSGNITSDRLMLVRAEEGQIIHQYWQSLYEETDEKEVVVDGEYTQGDYRIAVSGESMVF